MLLPFALFILALVSIVAIASARNQAAECDTLSEGCARAHGALWLTIRDLVRATPTAIVDRAQSIAAARGKRDPSFCLLASMLATEIRFGR